MKLAGWINDETSYLAMFLLRDDQLCRSSRIDAAIQILWRADNGAERNLKRLKQPKLDRTSCMGEAFKGIQERKESCSS